MLLLWTLRIIATSNPLQLESDEFDPLFFSSSVLDLMPSNDGMIDNEEMIDAYNQVKTGDSMFNLQQPNNSNLIDQQQLNSIDMFEPIQSDNNDVFDPTQFINFEKNEEINKSQSEMLSDSQANYTLYKLSRVDTRKKTELPASLSIRHLLGLNNSSTDENDRAIAKKPRRPKLKTVNYFLKSKNSHGYTSLSGDIQNSTKHKPSVQNYSETLTDRENHLYCTGFQSPDTASSMSDAMCISLSSEGDYENFLRFFKEFFKTENLSVDLILDSSHKLTASDLQRSTNPHNYLTIAPVLDQKTLNLLLDRIKTSTNTLKIVQRRCTLSGLLKPIPHSCSVNLSTIPPEEIKRLAGTTTEILKFIKNHYDPGEHLLFNENIWKFVEDAFVAMINSFQDSEKLRKGDLSVAYARNLCEVLDRMCTALNGIDLGSATSPKIKCEEVRRVLCNLLSEENWIYSRCLFWSYFFKKRLNLAKQKRENFQKYHRDSLLFFRIRTIQCVFLNIKDAIHEVHIKNSGASSVELSILILLTQCNYKKIREYQIERNLHPFSRSDNQ